MNNSCLDQITRELLWTGQLARQLPSLNSPDLAFSLCYQVIPPTGSNYDGPVVSPLSSPGRNQYFIPARKQAKDARGGTAKHDSVKILSTLQICHYDQHMGSSRVS